MSTRRQYSDHGFVLVNALVLVAAMAAVAVFLLARAESARVQLQQRQGGDQLAYYLDGFDALAITLLNRDVPSVDHTGEAWAKADYTVPVDRGTITGQITDLQGLYNLNWLSDPSNERARAAFDMLLAQIGVTAQSGQAIVAYIRPGGPELRQAYARLDPPLDPVGGALLMFEQLHDIPQLSDRDIERLRAFTTVLPGDTPLNLNTTNATILAGFLPELSPAVLTRLLSVRTRDPYPSTTAFLNALEGALGEGLDESFDIGHFSVGSDWFAVSSAAQLGDQSGARTTVLQRQPFPVGTTVRWRITTRP